MAARASTTSAAFSWRISCADCSNRTAIRSSAASLTARVADASRGATRRAWRAIVATASAVLIDDEEWIVVVIVGLLAETAFRLYGRDKHHRRRSACVHSR